MFEALFIAFIPQLKIFIFCTLTDIELLINKHAAFVLLKITLSLPVNPVIVKFSALGIVNCLPKLDSPGKKHITA